MTSFRNYDQSYTTNYGWQIATRQSNSWITWCTVCVQFFGTQAICTKLRQQTLNDAVVIYFFFLIDRFVPEFGQQKKKKKNTSGICIQWYHIFCIEDIIHAKTSMVVMNTVPLVSITIDSPIYKTQETGHEHKLKMYLISICQSIVSFILSSSICHSFSNHPNIKLNIYSTPPFIFYSFIKLIHPSIPASVFNSCWWIHYCLQNSFTLPRLWMMLTDWPANSI